MVRHNVPLNTQDWSQVVLAKYQYPQQNNNDDCGIFTLMAAECLTKGLNIDFNSGHMGFFRRRIAINILKKVLMVIFNFSKICLTFSLIFIIPM